MRLDLTCEGMSPWPRYFLFKDGIMFEGPFESYFAAEDWADYHGLTHWVRDGIILRQYPNWPFHMAPYTRKRLVEGVEIRSER